MDRRKRLNTLTKRLIRLEKKMYQNYINNIKVSNDVLFEYDLLVEEYNSIIPRNNIYTLKGV